MLIPPRRSKVEKMKYEGNNSPAASGINRARGRPMKRRPELKLPNTIQRKREKLLQQSLRAAVTNNPEPYELSPLEALPVELIQQIFFYSLEVNLPRASSHIAAVLSNPSIYSALILFAYFQEDGESPVEEQLFLPAHYRVISVEDKIRLQQSILSCQWCDVDLFKSCMPNLSRLQMIQAWHRETKAEAELDTSECPQGPQNPAIEQRNNQGLQPFAARPPSITDIEVLERHFMAKASPAGNDFQASDGQFGLSAYTMLNSLSQGSQAVRLFGPTGHGNYLPRIVLWRSYLGYSSPKPFHKMVDGCASIIGTRILPDHILEGNPSWDKPKLELLMLLRQGARFFHPVHEFERRHLECSPGALYEGMASAIKSHNLDALLVLLEIHFDCMRDPERLSDDRKTPHHIAVLFTSPIPVALFHLACEQPYPASSFLLSPLIREGIDSIPLDDRILTAWAVRHSDDRVAGFLLRHMEGANDYGKYGEPVLFWNGSQTRTRPQDPPFPDTSFTQQIGYLERDVIVL
ncbi:hypothetical protein LTR84_002092 [Exophiala bonariae]|uniref:F-box domain-containing protein n=1 Tax=Exophiala bonariae TaxID=1690606 RepID=A0AAV9NBA6_9EURO|nr:hypothetical protein LTR84_002092 [Exophiala bonariae]